MTGPNVVQVNGPRYTWKRVTWTRAMAYVATGHAKGTRDYRVLDLATDWDAADRAADEYIAGRVRDRQALAPSSR